MAVRNSMMNRHRGAMELWRQARQVDDGVGAASLAVEVPLLPQPWLLSCCGPPRPGRVRSFLAMAAGVHGGA
jgi:hypothetical protein